MGRNGAGKSTLLRHAAGLMKPTRGHVRSAGRVALLLQNPTDYLIHERVSDEASAASLAAVGLGAAALADRHPRDLSGGEKQRLALAIVLDEDRERGARAMVACLDEPTRGMDRGAKEALAVLLRSLADRRRWWPLTTRSSSPRSPSGWCCWPTARRSPTDPPPRC